MRDEKLIIVKCVIEIKLQLTSGIFVFKLSRLIFEYFFDIFQILKLSHTCGSRYCMSKSAPSRLKMTAMCFPFLHFWFIYIFSSSHI